MKLRKRNALLHPDNYPVNDGAKAVMHDLFTDDLS